MTRLGRACIVAIWLLGTAATAACGDDDQERAPAAPGKGGTTTPDTAGPTATPTTATTEAAPGATPRAELEALVIAAYDSYWQDLLAAGDPPDPDAVALRDHRTDDLLGIARDQLRALQGQGLVIRGRYIPHTRLVDLTDDTAVLLDCGQNEVDLVNAATGEVVQAADGRPDGTRAELVLDDTTWKVDSLLDDENACP